MEKPPKSIFKQRKGQNTPSSNPGIQITRVTNNVRPMSAMPLKNGITKNIRSRQATSKMLAVKTSLLMKELECLPKPPPREYI